MRNIQTPSDLHELQNETYVYAVLVVAAIVGLTVLFSNAIAYRGRGDRSYVIRRIWWGVITAVCSLGFYVYNATYVMSFIKKAAFQNQFGTTNLICLGITMVGSIVLSVILMMCFRHKKIGSILGKEKNA